VFDFVRRRVLFYSITAVLLIPGLISLVLPGGLRPGIDFTSGTIMTLRFEQPVQQAELRDALGELGHGEAIVQSSDNDSFVVRTRPLTQVDVNDPASQSEIRTIQDTLQARFGNVELLNLDQVSP